MKQNIGATVWEAFSPLRISNFRTYIIGQAISQIGTWLQLTAQGWVVWELSKSTAALGLVAMLGSLPILVLGPWAGAWADRLDRRRLLIATQIGAMLLAFILTVLTQLGIVQLWHVYLLSAILGVVAALDMPAQQAFIGDLSGMVEVRKAVNINAMILQIGRILGPVLAGLVIGAWGVPLAFWLNGLSFVAVIISLIIVTTNQVRATHSMNLLGEIQEGLQFVRQQPRIQDLITFVILITFFGFPILNLLPAVADAVLKGNARTLSWLMAASGAGALVGTLVIVPLAQSLKRAGVVVGSAVFWMGLWFVAFSIATWLPFSLVSLFLVSMAVPVVFTTVTGLIQMLAPPNMRARLLSLMVMISFGMQPFSALLMGYGATAFGTPTAIRVSGSLLWASALLMLMLRPQLRHWELIPQATEVTTATTDKDNEAGRFAPSQAALDGEY